MTDTYYYGDLTRKEQRDADRNRSRINAGSWWSGNQDYMTKLGKEGITRQQEHILSRADDVASEYDAADYLKKRSTRKRPARKR